MDRSDDQAMGDQLRRERTRRRLTLAQVAQATRIRERFLEAIEADEVEGLPNPVVTVGFVRIYARYLGFDPEPFVRAYQERTRHLQPREAGPGARPAAYTRHRGRSFVVPVVFLVCVLALAAYLYQQVATYVSGAGVTTGLYTLR